MQFPITIGLRRSRFLDLLILLSALSASAAIVYWPQAIAIQSLAVAGAWSLAALAWRHSTPCILAMRLERSGQVSVAVDAGAPFVAARLLPGATVHPWLTILRLELADGRQCTVVAAVDSLKKEDFRRLRVLLGWQAEFSVSADDA